MSIDTKETIFFVLSYIRSVHLVKEIVLSLHPESSFVCQLKQFTHPHLHKEANPMNWMKSNLLHVL